MLYSLSDHAYFAVFDDIAIALNASTGKYYILGRSHSRVRHELLAHRKVLSLDKNAAEHFIQVGLIQQRCVGSYCQDDYRLNIFDYTGWWYDGFSSPFWCDRKITYNSEGENVALRDVVLLISTTALLRLLGFRAIWLRLKQSPNIP
jgi:hypothetical protein